MKRLRAYLRTYGKHFVENAFRWRAGRQGTGYEKMLLAVAPWPLPFDTYLLRYPEGASVPPHKDPASIGGRHYRLNVVVKKPAMGDFFCEGKPIFQTDRVVLFRPDIQTHEVRPVLGGPRYVLSIGWIRR